LSSKREFRKNRLSDTCTLFKGVNEFLILLQIFRKVSDDLGLNKISERMPLSHHKCRNNWFSENHTLLKGVNTILSYFPHFYPTRKIFGKEMSTQFHILRECGFH